MVIFRDQLFSMTSAARLLRSVPVGDWACWALIDLSASITESRANFDLNRVVVTEKKKKKVSEP